MDLVVAIAGVVSALAALGAVWFAYHSVFETRALRREDRLARLPELVVDVGESLLDFQGGSLTTGRTHGRIPSR